MVVVVHGYTACRRDGWVLLAAGMLHRHGFAVLAIDLRNHGDSGRTGGRHTGGIRESADVLGAWDWLVTERHVAPEADRPVRDLARGGECRDRRR